MGGVGGVGGGGTQIALRGIHQAGKYKGAKDKQGGLRLNRRERKGRGGSTKLMGANTAVIQRAGENERETNYGPIMGNCEEPATRAHGAPLPGERKKTSDNDKVEPCDRHDRGGGKGKEKRNLGAEKERR